MSESSTTNTPSAQPKQQRGLGHWQVQVISAAGVLYILRCALGTFLSPGLAMAFLAGMLCGTGGLVLVVVCLAFILTKEHTPGEAEAPPGLPRQLSQGMADGQGPKPKLEGPTVLPTAHLQPPHTFTWACEYQGYVWTVPSTRFEKSDVLQHWPPHTKGAKALAKRWYATLGPGELLLQEADPPPHLPQGTLPRSVSVDLSVCNVRVVLECLSGRTIWMRKGPLEVSHVDGKTILHGESSFMLFAPDGAAKEQWFVALTRAAGGQAGGRTAAIQELFGRYTALLKARSPGLYPQDGDNVVPGGEGASGPLVRAGGAKKGWGIKGGLFRRAATNRDKAQKPRKPSLDVNAMGSPEELLELHWHGGPNKPHGTPNSTTTTTAGPASAGPADGAAAAVTPSGVGQAAAAESSKAAGSADSHPHTQLHKAHIPGKQPQEVVLQLLSQQPAADFDTTMDSATSSGASPRAASATELSGAPVLGAQLVGTGDAMDVNSSSTTQLTPVQTGSAAQVDEPSTAASRSPSPRAPPGVLHGPPQHPGWTLDFGINMLLARAFFDVLRNPKAKELMKARFQRKLSFMKVPEFITQLRVVDVSLGTSPPQVANCRAVPSPNEVLWPQGFFDFSYHGDLTLTIETSVDIREGAMWNQFDKAMSQLEGKPVTAAKAKATPAGRDHASSAAAARKDDDDVDSSSDEDGDVVANVDLAPDALPGAAAAAPPPIADTGKEVAGTSAAEDAAVHRTPGRARLMNLSLMRKAAAATIRQFADRTADQISRIPLRLTVCILRISGPMYIWVPPPPSNRLWFSYTQQPEMDIRATPELGSRILRHPAIATRVSSMMESKIRSAFTKNLVYPMCSDLVAPLFMDLDCDNVADDFDLPLPGLDTHPDPAVDRFPSAPTPQHSAPPASSAAAKPPKPVEPTAQTAAGLLHAASAPALTDAAAVQSQIQGHPGPAAPGAHTASPAQPDVHTATTVSKSAVQDSKHSGMKPCAAVSTDAQDSKGSGHAIPPSTHRALNNTPSFTASVNPRTLSPREAQGEAIELVATEATRVAAAQPSNDKSSNIAKLAAAGPAGCMGVAAHSSIPAAPPQEQGAPAAAATKVAVAPPTSSLTLQVGARQLDGTFVSPPGTPAGAALPSGGHSMQQAAANDSDNKRHVSTASGGAASSVDPPSAGPQQQHSAQADIQHRAAAVAEALGKPVFVKDDSTGAVAAAGKVAAGADDGSSSAAAAALPAMQASTACASVPSNDMDAVVAAASSAPAAGRRSAGVKALQQVQEDMQLHDPVAASALLSATGATLLTVHDSELTTAETMSNGVAGTAAVANGVPVSSPMPSTAGTSAATSPRSPWLPGGIARQISDDITKFLGNTSAPWGSMAGTTARSDAGMPAAAGAEGPVAPLAEPPVDPVTLHSSGSGSMAHHRSVSVESSISAATPAGRHSGRTLSDGELSFTVTDGVESPAGPSFSEASASSAPAQLTPSGSTGPEGQPARKAAWMQQRVAITQANSQKLVAGISQAIKANPHAKRFTENLKKGIEAADARLRKNLQPPSPQDRRAAEEHAKKA